MEIEELFNPLGWMGDLLYRNYKYFISAEEVNRIEICYLEKDMDIRNKINGKCVALTSDNIIVFYYDCEQEQITMKRINRAPGFLVKTHVLKHEGVYGFPGVLRTKNITLTLNNGEEISFEGPESGYQIKNYNIFVTALLS